MATIITLRKAFLLTLLFIALAVWVSCGGSKASCVSTSCNLPGAPGQAQGVYTGTLSNGDNFEALVTPADAVYAVYGSVSGTVFTIDGLITGDGSENNTTYTATVNDFNYTGVVTSGSISGTFSPGVSISGTITEGSNAITFSGAFPPTSDYNYNTAPSTSTLANPWFGNLLDGETANLVIDSSGNLTGTTSAGCSLSGSVTPDSSGKNFFDATVTTSGSCSTAGQSFTGVAILVTADGLSELLAAVKNSGNSVATVFIGTIAVEAGPHPQGARPVLRLR